MHICCIEYFSIYLWDRISIHCCDELPFLFFFSFVKSHQLATISSQISCKYFPSFHAALIAALKLLATSCISDVSYFIGRCCNFCCWYWRWCYWCAQRSNKRGNYCSGGKVCEGAVDAAKQFNLFTYKFSKLICRCLSKTALDSW